MNNARDGADLIPRHAWNRIEIDPEFVGMVEIIRSNRMRMKLEAGEIGHPDQRGRIPRNDFFGGSPRRKSKRDDVDPRGTRGRRTFLVEKLAANAVRVSNEHVRP